MSSSKYENMSCRSTARLFVALRSPSSWSCDLAGMNHPCLSRLHHRLDARQCGNEVAEPGAADFKIAVLVERGAGRRQQHDGIGNAGCFGVARGIGDRALERFPDLVRHRLA